METKKILVIDDEQDLCDILLFNLRAAGYEAEAVCSAEEALRVMSRSHANGHPGLDLLLLDVMMPGISGFDLAGRLKVDARTRHIPVIFLTAKDTEDDTLRGFSLGADDYVTKPFSVREVIARVRAVLNRKPAPTPSLMDEDVQAEGLSVNVVNKTICIDGHTVAITRTEYELMKLFLEHRGEVFSRQQLLEQAWPSDVIVTERTVDVNIARLRKKLGRYAACLVSRTGFGYMFDTNHE